MRCVCAGGSGRATVGGLAGKGIVLADLLVVVLQLSLQGLEGGSFLGLAVQALRGDPLHPCCPGQASWQK